MVKTIAFLGSVVSGEVLTICVHADFGRMSELDLDAMEVVLRHNISESPKQELCFVAILTEKGRFVAPPTRVLDNLSYPGQQIRSVVKPHLPSPKEMTEDGKFRSAEHKTNGKPGRVYFVRIIRCGPRILQR